MARTKTEALLGEMKRSHLELTDALQRRCYVETCQIANDGELKIMMAEAVDKMLDSLDVHLGKKEFKTGEFVDSILKDASPGQKLRLAAYRFMNVAKVCKTLTYQHDTRPYHDRSARAYRTNERVDVPQYLKTQDFVIGILKDKLNPDRLSRMIAKTEGFPALLQCAEAFGMKHLHKIIESCIRNELKPDATVAGISAIPLPKDGPYAGSISYSERALSTLADANATEEQKGAALVMLLSKEKCDLKHCIERLIQRGELSEETKTRYEAHIKSKSAEDRPGVAKRIASIWRRAVKNDDAAPINHAANTRLLGLIDETIPQLGIPTARIVRTMNHDPRLEHAVSFAQDKGLQNVAEVLAARHRTQLQVDNQKLLSLMI